MSDSRLSSILTPASPLDHTLLPHLEQFLGFQTLGELERSEAYQVLKPEVERVLESVHVEHLPGKAPPARDFVRVTAWNIERGLQLPGILEAFRRHPELAESDVLLLTELDYGMARTQNLFVAREIASCLGMSYAFAPSYLNLCKGSGIETRSQGENRQALHGNALFSRYPIRNVESIALPNGKDKMQGSEKRLGCQRAVLAEIDHPLGAFRAVSLHLDAHSSQRHRQFQMKLVLNRLEELSPRRPVVIGGDWNTSTYNSQRALYSILGYCRRVLMGIRNVVRNHYPHPDRWFERHLFRELEHRGYRYRDLNQPGACTLHYDVEDMVVKENMAEWIPLWCFWFIRWALKRTGGTCSLKLDWFAGKDLIPRSDSPPRVIHEVNHPLRLSDHDPIVLDFYPAV